MMIGKTGTTHPALQASQQAQNHAANPVEDQVTQEKVAHEVSHAGTTQAAQGSSQSEAQPRQNNQGSKQHQPASESSPDKAVKKSGETKESTATPTASQKTYNVNGHELDQVEYQQVQELKHRDREVRQHEAAHLAAAGQHAQGGPSFTLQQGPDGKRYAVGGEVQIDTSPVAGDPQATIQKAQQIQSAALAPAEPSSQDRKVAAQAAQLVTQARVELNEQRQTEQEEQQEKTQRQTESGKPAQTEEASSHTSNANQKAASAYQAVADTGIEQKKSRVDQAA